LDLAPLLVAERPRGRNLRLVGLEASSLGLVGAALVVVALVVAG
jgi:hypothetical protein